MKNGRFNQNIAQLTPLLIILLDILCTAMLLMIGSRVYYSVSQTDRIQTEKTTLINYTVNKVRAADGAARVFVREENGKSVLVIEENYDGRIYETRIGSDGEGVRELFCEEGTGLDLSDGVLISGCADVSFSLDVNKRGKSVLKTSVDGTEVLTVLRSDAEDM